MYMFILSTRHFTHGIFLRIEYIAILIKSINVHPINIMAEINIIRGARYID